MSPPTVSADEGMAFPPRSSGGQGRAMTGPLEPECVPAFRPRRMDSLDIGLPELAEPVTPDDQFLAATTVAAYAIDTEDLVLLLDMIGLMP